MPHSESCRLCVAFASHRHTSCEFVRIASHVKSLLTIRARIPYSKKTKERRKQTCMAQSNDRNTKGGLFDDFSFSTVIASGLAAGTSFALSSQIGLAGSLIGVVIGGLASAAASQIYKSILRASAEKLSSNDGETGSVAIDDQASHDGNDATRVVDESRITDRTRIVDSTRITDKTRALGSSHDDVLKRGASVADTTIPSQPRAASVSGSSHVEEYAETGTPIAPVAIRAAARRRERDVIRRRATIFMAAAESPLPHRD